MTWQEVLEVALCDYWANSGTTTTVRNAEGLVEIQVGDISTKFTELSKTNYRVGICAIDVDLTSSIVNHLADLNNSLFVNAVSGGISNHQRRKSVFVFSNLLL